MEGEEQGAIVETASPTVSDSNGQPTAQAPIQPVQPPAEPQVPFHQHPRFQQLIRDGQMSRQTIAQLQSQVEQYQAKLAEFEKRQTQGVSTPEEDDELRKAGGALERILMRNPEALDRILSQHPKFKALAENSDKLLASQQGVTQMQQAQAQVQMRQAQSHIHGLATAAGLPNDPGYLQRLVRLVAAEAQQIPEGNERFQQGDLSVLDEAFKALQGNFLAHTQRAGTAALIDTKNRTASLPPVARGGAAGPPGIPKFDPTKDTVRDQLGRFQKAAAAMLAEGRGKE